MDITPVYQDVGIIQAHIYDRPKVAVKRWTCVECEDYQLPLALIIGFLSNAVPPISRTNLEIRKKPEYQAVLDIVRNSSLDSLLEYDATERSIRYRDGVEDSTKEAIAAYINARASVIAD